MMDPQFFDTPSEPISLDISRMPTVRLVPPRVAGDIARRREEAARQHEMEARRLRSIADSLMTRFEQVSQETMAQLDEWLALGTLPERTLPQERRYEVLRRELEQVERELARQWAQIAGLLRTAAHHEMSAEILRTGHFSHG